MSEPIWCNIQVRVPRSWVASPDSPAPWFIERMSLCNGDTYLDDTDVEALLWCSDGEANYGLGDSYHLGPMLEWLEANRIPYRAIEDSKFEWLGEYRVFDGNDVHSADYAGESVVLTETAFLGYVAKHPAPNGHLHTGVLAEIGAYFDKTNIDITKVSIDHLPAEMPEEPTE